MDALECDAATTVRVTEDEREVSTIGGEWGREEDEGKFGSAEGG